MLTTITSNFIVPYHHCNTEIDTLRPENNKSPLLRFKNKTIQVKNKTLLIKMQHIKKLKAALRKEKILNKKLLLQLKEKDNNNKDEDSSSP